MYTIIINDVLIPDNDVIEIDMPLKDVVSNEFKLESASLTVTLNNNIPGTYDPDYVGSLFHSDWYNLSIVVINQETELTVFKGKIKERIKQKTTNKNIVKIKADNVLKDILKTKINTAWGTSDNKTPSEIIYSILTGVCQISPTQINEMSFQISQDYQYVNGGFLIVSYSVDNEGDAGKVINDIMKFTNSHLYSIDNIFHYYQWQPYANENSGVVVSISDIVNGTYQHGSNDKVIYNSYKLIYDNAGAATVIDSAGTGNDITATERAYLNASVVTYGGELQFSSHEDSESIVSADYQTLYKSLVSAQFYGRLILQRFHHVTETAQLSITAEKFNRDSIALLQQIDLTYENYSREPLRIYGTELKQKTNLMNLTMEWLDIPHLSGTDPRDKTKPDAIEIIYAYISGSEELTISFTPSIDPYLSYYNLYLSVDNIVWNNVFSGIGLSPLAVTISEIETIEGTAYYTLSGLEIGMNYYLKMTALDTARNESFYSNTVKVYIYDSEWTENSFYVDGDLYSTGITIDEANSLGGTDIIGDAIFDTAQYDIALYDTIDYEYESYATYASNVLYSATGFISLVFQCAGSAGDAFLQWRTYENGVYGLWSDMINAVGIVILPVSGNWIQFRILFDNTDDDFINPANIKLIRINEV